MITFRGEFAHLQLCLLMNYGKDGLEITYALPVLLHFTSQRSIGVDLINYSIILKQWMVYHSLLQLQTLRTPPILLLTHQVYSIKSILCSKQQTAWMRRVQRLRQGILFLMIWRNIVLLPLMSHQLYAAVQFSQTTEFSHQRIYLDNGLIKLSTKRIQNRIDLYLTTLQLICLISSLIRVKQAHVGHRGGEFRRFSMGVGFLKDYRRQSPSSEFIPQVLIVVYYSKTSKFG